MAKTNAERQAGFRQRRDSMIVRLKRAAILKNVNLREDLATLRRGLNPATVQWWYVAWIKRRTTKEPSWGLMHTRKPKTHKLPDGSYLEESFYEKYATEAEAQRRCDELNADETDSRFSYMPFSQWKKDATHETCGIRPWTTREEDEAAIEFSCRLHEDLNPTQ